jgi:hypothetical protein
MNFLTVSKEQKLEIYNKRINNVEQEIFSKVLELGIDADFFDFNEFMNSFDSIEKWVDNYSVYKNLNDICISYLSIKDKINLLEKE